MTYYNTPCMKKVSFDIKLFIWQPSEHASFHGNNINTDSKHDFTL